MLVQFTQEEKKRLKTFLRGRGLARPRFLAKGHSARIFTAKKGKGLAIVVKLEREDSPRQDMVEKESQNLRLANRLGIGPKLLSSFKKHRALVMEFVPGLPFSTWLLDKNPKKGRLEKVLADLLEQAAKLDAAGLDHGQLAGRGTNIFVNPKTLKVTLLDFEKASAKRKPHNVTQLTAFLFRNPHGAIAKKIREILGKRKG